MQKHFLKFIQNSLSGLFTDAKFCLRTTAQPVKSPKGLTCNRARFAILQSGYGRMSVHFPVAGSSSGCWKTGSQQVSHFMHLFLCLLFVCDLSFQLKKKATQTGPFVEPMLTAYYTFISLPTCTKGGRHQSQ